jgi:hypothetical protein
MRRIAIAFGLSLLYASAYFLNFLNPYSLYFIPSFLDYIVIPSLVGVMILTPAFLFFSSAKINIALRLRLLFFGAAVLTVIAVKSLFDAAGYSWTNILVLFARTSQDDAPYYFRWARVLLVGLSFSTVFVFIYIIRKNLSQWLRWLSTLGYAFLFLAIFRSFSSDLVFPSPSATVNTPALASSATPRRVVWVIFDEMDYGLSLGQKADENALQLPNFARLAARGVSASAAYSPGRDTLYSIPALLTGTSLSGMAIAPQNKLTLLNQDGKSVPFDIGHSLFARLPGGPKTASILGFYHPYCKIFSTLQACDSTYLGNAGRWFDSLLFFSEAIFSTARHLKWLIQYLPERLLFYFDPMYRVSSNELSHLDEVLANRHSSLDFIHLNLPHLPNVYVQRLTGQPINSEMDAYKKNLVGADMVLGRIVQALESVGEKQNILLIVSSDHWLRTHSKQPGRIPFIAWKVGATDALTVQRPVSTVHSSKLVLDFLHGTLNSQVDIADQLGRTTFYKTWSAPDGYKY